MDIEKLKKQLQEAFDKDMTLVERIDNLTDEQRKQILIKTRKDMERVLRGEE